MFRLRWHDAHLTVRRLVFRRDDRSHYTRSLLPLARRVGLDVADESAEPRTGDFWVGCQPDSGWGADRASIGWASVVEVPVAVAALLAHESPGDGLVAGVQAAFAHDRPHHLSFS